MAAPNVAATATSNHSDRSGTSFTLNLPSGVANKDLLVAIFSVDNPGSDTVVEPSDWTQIYQGSDNRNGFAHGAAFYYVADGTEGSTVTFTVPNRPTTAVCYRIQNAGDVSNSALDPESSVTYASTTSYFNNPPSITPSGGADDYLFIAAASVNTDDVNQIFNTPDNYTTGYVEATDSPGAGLHYGYRETTNVTTEDPTTWEHNATATRDRVIATIAIYPKPWEDLSLNAGSYALSGKTAELMQPLDLATGTYTGTGYSADLNISAADLVLITGSYGVTGASLDLLKVWPSIDLVAGTYAIVGPDGSLIASLQMGLVAGVYTFTGQSQDVVRQWQALDLTAGSNALTGPSAALGKQWQIILTEDNYNYTGVNVDLSYVTASLAALPGSFSVSGLTGTLTKSWNALNLALGGYELDGLDQDIIGPPADFGYISQVMGQALVTLTPCNLYRAQVWKITRTDGTAYRYTTHDQALSFKDESYKPCDSLKATAGEAVNIGQQGQGDVEIGGILSDTDITERDLANGLFDGATVEVWRIPWNDPTYASDSPKRILKGTLSKTSQSGLTYTATVLSPSAKLAQRPLLDVYAPGCRFEIGDGRCPVDVNKLTVSGAVEVSGDRIAIYRQSYRQFIDTTLTGANPGSASDSISSVGYEGYYAGGLLTWTSGSNINIQSEVKSYESATGLVTLWDSMPNEIEVGDTYTIKPGCAKTQADHTTKFGLDMDSYGGFPDLPGADAIIRGPDRR